MDQTDFMPVVNASNDHNTCAIQEYLGAEISETGRQRDVRDNPHITTQHNFAFDHVYGP
jgi:hypothetical protein